MYITKSTIQAIESQSKITVETLIKRVGDALFHALVKEIKKTDRIVILCGKGNNGADGFALAQNLSKQYNVQVILVDGMPKSKAALHFYRQLPASLFIDTDKIEAICHADVIIDAVYGFGFHGIIKSDLREIFQAVHQSTAKVFSIDINSGCVCDDIYHDVDTIVSDITYALHEKKLCQAFNKTTELAKKIEVLDISLPKGTSDVAEMNEDIFFRHFPCKETNAYKGTHGITTLIASSYGMPGALGLNILGAKTIGAGYINALTSEEVYPIVASHFLTPVYHPFNESNWFETVKTNVIKSKAIGYGSGCTNLLHKHDILDVILQYANCPVILDAEAIRLLINNYYILNFVHEPVVLTPHIGEFAALINKPISYINDHRVELCVSFAKRYKVYLVLKGTNTLVVSPSGEMYVNQTGNAALAQAGSGDILTGMITSMCTLVEDPFVAVCMAVWLHGHLADTAMQSYAMQNFDLTLFPALANKFFHFRRY